jgi:hypothetical protein
MRLTSDTLFHFTTKLKDLESILINKFKLSYCKEEIHFSKTKSESYFPMVTFCDIPLSLAKDHIRKYGNYAIGLSKDWGIKNKLNPVIYVEKNSLIAEDLEEAKKLLRSIVDKRKIIYKEKSEEWRPFHLLDQEINKLSYVNLNILRYCKNYIGNLERNNKVINNYRFYDEREWRFIPNWDNNEVKGILDKKEYEDYRGDKKSPKPLINNITLKFNANDIKYIIVKSEKDIPKMIRIISSVNNLIENKDEADILSSKILTIDQLNQDF